MDSHVETLFHPVRFTNIHQVEQRFHLQLKNEIETLPEATLWYRLYMELSLRGFKERVIHQYRCEFIDHTLTIDHYYSIDRTRSKESSFDARFRAFLEQQMTLLSLTNQFDQLVNILSD
jgi:hypothetical protein|nr:MAG TPA: hypothetical protein [Caudoviricetes sp.]